MKLFDQFKTDMELNHRRLARQWSHRREQSEVTCYSVVTTKPGVAAPHFQELIIETWPDGTFDVKVGHSCVLESADVGRLVTAILLG